MIEPPALVNPTHARRAPDGRLALRFPEGPQSRPEPFWLVVAIRGDLYVELVSDEDVADWAEVIVDARRA